MNFWDYHGWAFILVMFFFPRITMLVATTTGAGFLYWIGWLIAPRLTVAIIATYLFGHDNTALVVFSWVWALGGEGFEKGAVGTAAIVSDGNLPSVR